MKQQELFDSLHEASYYHSATGQGFFSLLVQDQYGAKKQQSYRLSQMAQIIPLLDQHRDTWISQAEFWQPNRRVVNLARIGLLFADLDTYHCPAMIGRTPEQQAAALNFYCDDEGIPRPSLIIYSGRGLQAKWLLQTALPRAAMPRWKAVQTALNQRLSNFGSDRNAMDASRVLRLINTVNTKSGEIARLVDVNGSSDPEVYDFDYLADELLPLTRMQIEQQREQRKVAKAARLQLAYASQTSKQNERFGHFKSLNSRTLAWHRLEDIRTLGDLRGGWAEGSRDKSLFWQMNFLALAGAVHEQNLAKEAQELAKIVYGSRLSEYEPSSVGTLIEKARLYAQGADIEFHGKRYPALYTPRNSTLIDIFEITTEEQRQLRTILDKSEAQRRDTAAQEVRRREQGVKPRAEYLTKANNLKAQILELDSQGMMVGQIAEQLGCSKRSVYLALK
ncbi:replication protein [Pseudomonas vlassakiae]|uniref:replication protein n=1 Tax=Pseudomonas vlassakiae TaxID=485888 RepID=UPI003D26F7EB